MSIASGRPTGSRSAPAAVLWDIDGTLISSGGVVARLFLDAVESVCGVRPIPTGLDFGGRLDPEIAELLITAVGGRIDHRSAVLTCFEALVAERDAEIRGHIAPLPGTRELVAEFAASSIVQSVVTGNLESVGRLKLDAGGFVPPLDLALAGFGASGPDRGAVAKVALSAVLAAGHLDDPRRCWIVGDTPRDLECARIAGVRCALVATGRYPMEALLSLGADLVLPSLVVADPLRDLLLTKAA